MPIYFNIKKHIFFKYLCILKEFLQREPIEIYDQITIQLTYIDILSTLVYNRVLNILWAVVGLDRCKIEQNI